MTHHHPDTPSDRPKTRADCEHGPRPCPWISCRYHLALSAVGHGNRPNSILKASHPLLFEDPVAALLDMPQTCALDLAEQGPLTLDEIGAHMALTRERTRQVETSALEKLSRAGLIVEAARASDIDVDAAVWIQSKTNAPRLQVNSRRPPMRRANPRELEDTAFFYGLAQFQRQLDKKAKELDGKSPQPIKRIEPTAEHAAAVMASLEADMKAKNPTGNESIKPRRPPVDFRPNKRPRAQREKQQHLPPQQPPPLPEPPMPKKPDAMRAVADRGISRPAAKRLREILTQRELPQARLAEALSQRACVSVNVAKRSIAELLRNARPFSVYWRRVAALLGVTLESLNPDPEWLQGVADDGLYIAPLDERAKRQPIARPQVVADIEAAAALVGRLNITLGSLADYISRLHKTIDDLTDKMEGGSNDATP